MHWITDGYSLYDYVPNINENEIEIESDKHKKSGRDQSSLVGVNNRR